MSRLTPYVAWIRARLSPTRYFGLQLTIGVLAFAGTAWVFGGITEDVLTGDPLTLFDLQAERWFHRHQVPWLTMFLTTVSRLHEWGGVTGATILGVLYLWWQREWRWILTWCAQYRVACCLTRF